MRTFWFGKDLPIEFADPAVRGALSFNGQLHFRCSFCNEVAWGDITFSKYMIKSGDDFSCPSCRKKGLEIVRFFAIESRVCEQCGTEIVDCRENQFGCALCGSGDFFVSETFIRPEYPRRLFVLYGRSKPIGESVKDDVDFLVEYVRGLRMSPQFHETCIHLVAFIESLFQHLYGSSPDAVDLMNVASGLMRTVYRETSNPDAGYLSIALMAEARDLTLDPIQRAVFGFNINQNLYSILAQGQDAILSVRFRFDVKQYAISLSRQTLAAFEAINQDWFGELRARQKWLLGDILKAGDPSEPEIDEALYWCEAALKDPALPSDVRNYVRESSLVARGRRKQLTPNQQRELRTDLGEIALANLDRTDGLQRINAFGVLLRGQFHLGDEGRLRTFSLQSLGEAITYVAANDPQIMLRHAGSILSRLVAGFAAERFRAGDTLGGLAGVEAFRSLAIQRYDNKTTTLPYPVSELELDLMMGRLLGNDKDPFDIAEKMQAEFLDRSKKSLLTLLDPKGRMLLWTELWEADFLIALVRRHKDEITVQRSTIPFSVSDATKAFSLPMADSAPGRLRARQLEAALRTGWQLLHTVLADSPSSQEVLFIGPSLIGSWPLDASEALQSASSSALRPITFAPSIQIASRMQERESSHKVDKVLLLSYGGSDLTRIEQEIRDIKSIYGSRLTLLDGARIRKAQVIEALSQPFDVVHFCGHGSFDYLQPMNSKIYFNDHEEEGSLTANDILNCRLMERGPVVVLSACTSALVLPNGSNNFLGLAGALIRTGASSIVGARWPISDNVAAAFSKFCHTQLAQGQGVSEAVVFAKEQLRDSRSDEWIAFMKIGG